MNAMIATITYCIVGCNTGSPEHDSLKVLECDTETGAAKIVQSVNGCEGTTYFQLSRDGKALYSAIGEKRDEKSQFGRNQERGGDCVKDLRQRGCHSISLYCNALALTP